MEGRKLGSYVIRRKLGEGGMGVVYVATHVQLGQDVAIKLLLPDVSKNPDIVARFFNEARAASLIDHPSIVRVLDVGTDLDGSAYFVMELLGGESLAARLRRGRPPIAKACLIARQIASALAAAHRAGIVHRDLKPDNIFLCPDPEVGGGERAKILDFGIAKLSSAAEMSKTRTGMLLGTPYYMSPEQARGSREIDGRSDIYALGCILYEMLTGRPPFQGDAPGEVLGQHLFVEPPAPRTLEPSLPTELEAVLLRTLVKEPSGRFPSMDDLAGALVPFAMPSAIASPPVTDAMRPSETVPPAPTVQVGRDGRPVWIAISAVAITVGAAAAVLIASGRAKDLPADAASKVRDGSAVLDAPIRSLGPSDAMAHTIPVAADGSAPSDAALPDGAAESDDGAADGAVAPDDGAPDGGSEAAPAAAVPPPWHEAKVAASRSAVVVAEWRKAENRRSCAALTFAETGERTAAAQPRRANFAGGWAVAWDQKGLPGTDSSGADCETCGRGVFGVAGAGVEAEGTNLDLFPEQLQYGDGSRAGYGPQRYSTSQDRYLAYLVIAEQGCLYNVWTQLGKEHMELLLANIRYVAGAP